MKRLFVILLFLCVSCATLPIKMAQESDLQSLKGKWDGFINVSSGAESSMQRTELVTNESLEGKIAFYMVTQGPVTYDFCGKIENGKIICFWEDDRWARLNLHKGNGTIEMRGQFRWRQWSGTLFLKKIR